VFVLEGNKACVRFISSLNVLVFVLEENLRQPRILIHYNVFVGNVLVFVVDINLALNRFITLQCCYVIVIALNGNPTHVKFSFTLKCCDC